MNKSQKYRIGNIEIIAFIVAVLMMIVVFRLFFSEDSATGEVISISASAFVVVLFATLFGPVTGALTGSIGIVVAFVTGNLPISCVDVISFGLLGLLIGVYADKYLIREGGFSIKQMTIWNLVNMLSIMSSVVFVRPELDYFINNKDLIQGIAVGMRVFFICAIPGGVILTLVFLGISRFCKYVSYRPTLS